MQTFIRNCSSDRGNICSGGAIEIREDKKACQDDNGLPSNPEFSRAKCSGPNPAYVPPSNFTLTTGQLNYITNNSEYIYCFNYSGETFEQKRGINIVIDNICTSAPQFAYAETDGAFYTYNDAATQANKHYNYQCDGTCSGNGNCSTPINCLCKTTTDSKYNNGHM